MTLSGRTKVFTLAPTTPVRSVAAKRRGRPRTESGYDSRHRGHGSVFEIDPTTGDLLCHWATGHESVWIALDTLKKQLVVNSPNQLRKFNECFPELIGNSIP